MMRASAVTPTPPAPPPPAPAPPTPPPLEAVDAHPNEHVLSGLRVWFAVFVLWMTALAVVFHLAFGRYEAGSDGVMWAWVLAGMAFYLSLCNTLIPLPTAWIILLAASEELLLFESPWLRIGLVAGVGALATAVANLNEYHVLGFLCGPRLSRRIRRTRIYAWGARWFNVSPFQTLTLVAFVPIPIDAVRWLAILRRYSRWRLAAAYLLGRTPRYALLAGLSVAARLTTWQIVLIQVAIVALLAARLVWTATGRLLRRSESAAATGQTLTVEQAVDQTR